jgi:hypothetical protein
VWFDQFHVLSLINDSIKFIDQIDHTHMLILNRIVRKTSFEVTFDYGKTFEKIYLFYIHHNCLEVLTATHVGLEILHTHNSCNIQQPAAG